METAQEPIMKKIVNLIAVFVLIAGCWVEMMVTMGVGLRAGSLTLS